ECRLLSGPDASKDEDRPGDPRLSKFDAFLKGGNGELVRPLSFKPSRTLNRAVTVRVRFDDRHDLDAFTDKTSNRVEVEREMIKIDLGECGAGSGQRAHPDL